MRLVRAANCDHDFKKKMGESILVLNGRELAQHEEFNPRQEQKKTRAKVQVSYRGPATCLAVIRPWDQTSEIIIMVKTKQNTKHINWILNAASCRTAPSYPDALIPTVKMVLQSLEPLQSLEKMTLPLGGYGITFQDQSGASGVERMDSFVTSSPSIFLF